MPERCGGCPINDKRLKCFFFPAGETADFQIPFHQGQAQLVRKYRDYLTNSENISLFPLDLNIADHAVELRARYHFKTPDAIQLGTAVACGADYVITNDRNWSRFEALQVVMVGDL